MPRIPLPTPETMTPDQRRVYDEIVAGPRARVVGPLGAALYQPELARVWAPFGAYLRFGTTVPARWRELAILVTARRWNSQVEWHIHAEAGRRAGLPACVVDAIRHARPPAFDDHADALVYEYARALQMTGQVPDDVYGEVLERLQAVGVVELTAVIGYYTLVSMTLNAHEIPVADEVEPPLRAVDGGNAFTGLTDLPPAVSAALQGRDAR